MVSACLIRLASARSLSSSFKTARQKGVPTPFLRQHASLACIVTEITKKEFPAARLHLENGMDNEESQSINDLRHSHARRKKPLPRRESVFLICLIFIRVSRDSRTWRGCEARISHPSIELSKDLSSSRERQRRPKSRCPLVVQRPSSSWHENPVFHGTTIHLVRPDTLITGFMLVQKRIKPPLPSHRTPLRALALLRSVFAFSLSSRKRKLTPLRFFARLPLRYGT